MKKPAVYEIRWNDAHGSDGTIFPHEIDHRPYVFTTVGYLIRSDDDGVTIAAELGEDGKVRDCTFIPRLMIIEESPYKNSKRSPRAKPLTKSDSPPTPSPESPSYNRRNAEGSTD